MDVKEGNRNQNSADDGKRGDELDQIDSELSRRKIVDDNKRAESRQRRIIALMICCFAAFVSFTLFYSDLANVSIIDLVLDNSQKFAALSIAIAAGAYASTIDTGVLGRFQDVDIRRRE